MKKARLLNITLVVSFFLSTPIYAVSAANSSAPPRQQNQRRRMSSRLIEEFSFLIKDFKVDHQGQNLVNINVKYRYKTNITLSEYPDFRLLAKDIESLLTNYPNETDYWEIVNKRITQMLLDKYGSLVSISCEIAVSPSEGVPYFRTSTTTRVRSSVRDR